MKKTIKTILCTLALAVLAVSCQKENNEVDPNTKDNIEISINGLMGEYTQVDATKAELVNTVRVSWKGDETVFVFDGTECIGSLVASLDGTEDRYALLSTDTDHTVKAPATGTTKLTLVYSPLLTEAPAVSDGAISISLADQNSTKAPFVAYATLDYTGTTITDALVPFKFATSVIRVNCTDLKANTAIDNATLSNANTECKLTLSGTGAPTVAGDVNGIITKTGDEYFAASKVNAEGEAVFQIAVPALETASSARVLTVAQGLYKFEDKNFSKKEIAAATSVNTVCQLVKALPAGALPGVFTVSDNDGGTTKQIYFSQGNLYYDGRKFNFEANQDDFEPSNDSEWNSEHISHFYWCRDERVAYSEEYWVPLFDYSITPDAGDVFFPNETETTAKASFTVNVEGKEQTGWRTLSSNEWQYLFNTRTVNGGTGADYSYSLGISYNHNMGLVLYPDNYTGPILYGSVETMPEGVVFLPAAGSHLYPPFINVGIYGYYWSSTALDESSAYDMYFSSSNVILGTSGIRNLGYSVRLVLDVVE